MRTREDCKKFEDYLKDSIITPEPQPLPSSKGRVNLRLSFKAKLKSLIDQSEHAVQFKTYGRSPDAVKHTKWTFPENPDLEWFDPTFVNAHYWKDVIYYKACMAVEWYNVSPVCTVMNETNHLIREWIDGVDGDHVSFLDIGKHRNTAKIIIIDFLLNQMDRKLSNVIIDKEGNPWAIDNEFILEPVGLKGYTWQVLELPLLSNVLKAGVSAGVDRLAWLNLRCDQEELQDNAYLVDALVHAVEKVLDEYDRVTGSDTTVHRYELGYRVDLFLRNPFDVAVQKWYEYAFKKAIELKNERREFTNAPPHAHVKAPRGYVFKRPTRQSDVVTSLKGGDAP